MGPLSEGFSNLFSENGCPNRTPLELSNNHGELIANGALLSHKKSLLVATLVHTVL